MSRVDVAQLPMLCVKIYPFQVEMQMLDEKSVWQLEVVGINENPCEAAADGVEGVALHVYAIRFCRPQQVRQSLTNAAFRRTIHRPRTAVNKEQGHQQRPYPYPTRNLSIRHLRLLMSANCLAILALSRQNLQYDRTWLFVGTTCRTPSFFPSRHKSLPENRQALFLSHVWGVTDVKDSVKLIIKKKERSSEPSKPCSKFQTVMFPLYQNT